ncbi:MAG: tetratricopeptide repeat protein [Planctomycetes bacterium]|nr:tetratricopeptide repeat protein [Planctomycetota bacterium]
MSRTARRGLGLGFFVSIAAIFAVWLLWQRNGHGPGPAIVEAAPQVGAAAQRLAELQARFDSAIHNSDPAVRASELTQLDTDIRADLSAGTFSGEKLVSARLLLVAVLRGLGNQAEVLSALGSYLDELAAQKGQQTARTALRRLADDGQAHEQYSEAADFFGLLQERWPNEPEACYGAYKLAECLERQGRMNDAIAAYNTCISSFPNGEWTGEAHLRGAWCYRMVRDFAGATKLYLALQAARPGTRYPATAQRQLAEMYMFEAHYEDAISAYQTLKTMVEPSEAEAIDRIIAELSEKLL